MACTSFIDIFDFIFVGNREPDLFAAVIWSLWNRRNNIRLGKRALPLDKLMDFARECLIESPASNLISLNPQQRQATKWTALETRGFKINFDGATFADDDTAGIGVVIRNDAGLVMASLTQEIPMPASVIEVEALAARRALELALELGFNDIILEGDSEILIKSLMNGGSELAHYGHLAADILFLLSHFSKSRLYFVQRQCNRLAHSLARRASTPPLMSVWMEEISPDLTSVFLVDLHNLP